jgi:hypothetical protein
MILLIEQGQVQLLSFSEDAKVVCFFLQENIDSSI